MPECRGHARGVAYLIGKLTWVRLRAG